MAKAAYIGVTEKARKVKNIYIGVNGIARKVKKGYIGVNGVARLFYDADAGGWTSGTLPSSANWTSVAFGNGRFVAVASGSQTAAYSTNGINWTSVSLPSSSTWNCVRYCKDRFIAVSGAGKAIYSTDGITWTALTLPVSSTWSSVGYNAEKGYYAIASSATSNIQCIYSTNGTTWKQGTQMSGPVSSMAYGNGKLIGVTTAATNNFEICSSTGGSWNMAIFISPTPSTKRSWYDVVYGTDRFVAVASGGKAAYSLTGSASSFTEVTLPVNATFRGVAYGNGKFVAVANASNQYIFSENGTLWTAGEMPSSANWRSVAYGNGRFVAVAYGSNKVACLAA